MKKRYYIKYKTVAAYLVIYLMAIAALVVYAMASLNSGDFSTTSMLISFAVIVAFSLLFLKEIRKGIFDKIEFRGDKLILSRLKKEIDLSISKIEKIEVVDVKNFISDKNIVIHFVKNSKGESFELNLEYRKDLLDELNENIGKK